MNWKAVIGVAISVALLWWALRDVSFAEVVRELRAADPGLFLLSVIAATLAFPIRAMRWKVLLLPVAPKLPFRPRFAAVNIGMAANNLIPARVGEFARALALSRLSIVPVGAALGSLVIERLFDGVILVTLLFVAMAMPGFPANSVGGVDPRAAAGVAGVALLVVGLAMFFLVFAPERSVAVVESISAKVLPESYRRPLVDALRSFLGGLGVLRDGRLFAASLAWAVGQWVFLAYSYHLALLAFDIHVGFFGAVFLQSLISLAVALPSSPGFFGPWEAAAKIALALWAVPSDKAVSFAVGFHLGGFVPVTLMGIWYVWRLNLRWRDVEASEGTVEDAVEADPPAGRGMGAKSGSVG